MYNTEQHTIEPTWTEHHFIVRAWTDIHGNTRFSIDDDEAEYRFPEGTVYDHEAGEWSAVRDEHAENDERFYNTLIELLAKQVKP